MYTSKIQKRFTFDIIIFTTHPLPPSSLLRQVYISAYPPNIIPNKGAYSKAQCEIIRNFCSLFFTFRLSYFSPFVIIFSSPAHILIFSNVILHFNWFHFKSLSNKNHKCYFFELNLKKFCGKRRKPRRTTQLRNLAVFAAI